jgi:hypothetical protein
MHSGNAYARSLTEALAMVHKSIEAFNRHELLRSIGGLQLLPENASNQIRFEALAHIAAALPDAPSKPAPSAHRLRSLLNAGPLAEHPIQTAEDPCDSPFTEEITFYGGSFLTLSGRGEETAFIVRKLAACLFQHRDKIKHNEFLAAAQAVIAAALVLSDAMTRRAGLKRGMAPVVSRVATVPDKAYLELLKHAVWFSEGDLEAAFAAAGQDLEGLARLLCPSNINTLDGYRIDEGQLLTRPVIRDGHGTTVPIPGCLVAAAVNSVIASAQCFGFSPQLAERFTDSIWRSVCMSLRRLDARPLRAELPPLGIPCGRDGLFHLDTDKLTYALLLCDPLTEYDPELFAQHWESKQVQQQARERAHQIAKLVFSMPEPPNEIFCLMVLQSPGRSFVMGLNEDEFPPCGEVLLLSASDLDTLSQLNDNEPLKLWKFAKARRHAGKYSRIVSTGILNEYAVYKSRDHSYYISDESRPTMMAFPPGSAGDLRREVASRVDMHGVPSYSGSAITEVGTLFSTREIPIYAELRNLGRQPTLLVEAYDFPVWVLGTDPDSHGERPDFAEQARFVDAVAYWLWQFAPSLSNIVSPDIVLLKRLVVKVQLLPHESWIRNDVAFPEPGAPCVEVKASVADSLLSVVIRPNISASLRLADNSGERLIVEAMLRGLRELVPDGAEKLNEAVIASLLEKHAPLGPKRRLFVLGSDTAPLQNAHGLPEYRPIQDADDQAVLDDLGDRLIEEEGLAIAEIPVQQQNTVTNQAVALLYSELEQLVASLSSEELLDWLIAHYERVVVKQDYYEMNIPARIACFSSYSDMLRDLLEEAPLQAASAGSARFILEYVVARPPKGLRPISLSVHDRLQALASHIINLGFVSDMIRYELSDVAIKLLPSRRIAFNKEKFDAALDSYQAALAPDQIEHAHELFARRFETADAAPETQLIDELNAAVKAEFAFSFDELTDFHHSAVKLGWERSKSGVAALPTDEFLQKMSSHLQWSIKRTEECLEITSLGPRADFLKPPHPFTKEDVYPWRFNRPLSYVRRPFLKRSLRSVEEVIWGSRQVLISLQFFAHLCSSGRLRAQSLAMKQFLSKLNNARGTSFNRSVAAALRQNSLIVVRENVKKVPGLTGLREIGEIDVLAAHSRERRLFVIECKDLAMARTPHELALELDRLFIGVGGKASIVDRLATKTKWIKSHLLDIRRWMGLPMVGKWGCAPLVVTDRALVTPQLRKSSTRIVSIKQLREMFE